jgi:outer membrane protein
MTHFRKFAAVMFLLPSVFAAGLPAQEKMNLQQFIDEAVRNSASVQIAGEAVAGAGFKVKEAKSQTLPLVSLASTYTRISLVQEFDIPGMGHFKFSTPDNLGFRAAASEQIFTWGRIKSGVEMSKIGVSMSENGVAMTKQMLAYQVVPMFYGVLFTQEAVKVVDQTLARLRDKVTILEERYKAGLASDFDISLLKVQASGLEAQKLDFQNNVRKVFMAYNRIVGRPLDTAIALDGDINVEAVRTVEELQAEAQTLVEEAVANRPEARQAEDQRRMAQAQITLAKSADKPNVGASFFYEMRNGFIPNTARVKGFWSALLNVSYPVFDGRRTSAQVAQAQVALRTADEQAADLERGIALEINQILADLKALELKIAIEKSKIAHAERALKIADERYQNGLISTTDLVDAQDSLDSARLNYLRLRYDYVLGRYNLLKAVGRKIYS